jgi:signal peptidase I
MNKLVNMAAVVTVVLLIVISALVYISPKFGYRVSEVVSGSMKPTLNVGTMVISHKVSTDIMQVGDIITFRYPYDANATPICHRIVDISATRPLYFTTGGDAYKGDAVNYPDKDLVSATSVLGLVEFHAPLLGYFISFLSEKIGLVVGLIIPAIIIIILIFRIFWKELVKYIRTVAK